MYYYRWSRGRMHGFSRKLRCTWVIICAWARCMQFMRVLSFGAIVVQSYLLWSALCKYTLAFSTTRIPPLCINLASHFKLNRHTSSPSKMLLTCALHGLIRTWSHCVILNGNYQVLQIFMRNCSTKLYPYYLFSVLILFF